MKIKKGQQIDFKIPESSSEFYKAEVHLVGTSIQANRTIQVHGHIENEEEANFLAGMFVDASIITDSSIQKALPSEAIIEVDGVFYVLVLDRKEGETYFFNEQEVVVQENYDGFTVVENNGNLTNSTQFLTKGAFNLLGE